LMMTPLAQAFGKSRPRTEAKQLFLKSHKKSPRDRRTYSLFDHGAMRPVEQGEL